MYEMDIHCMFQLTHTVLNKYFTKESDQTIIQVINVKLPHTSLKIQFFCFQGYLLPFI